jgi:Flp pilus assembly protein TadB
MGEFIWYSLLAVGVGTLIAVGVLWFLLLRNGHTVRRLQEQNKALAARLALICTGFDLI